MVPFVGICIGGPYAGKRIGSYDREQKISFRDRPLSFSEMRQGNAEATVTYKYGVYRFHDEEWHWRDLD